VPPCSYAIELLCFFKTCRAWKNKSFHVPLCIGGTLIETGKMGPAETWTYSQVSTPMMNMTLIVSQHQCIPMVVNAVHVDRQRTPPMIATCK
jgi:hypothetical protein